MAKGQSNKELTLSIGKIVLKLEERSSSKKKKKRTRSSSDSSSSSEDEAPISRRRYQRRTGSSSDDDTPRRRRSNKKKDYDERKRCKVAECKLAGYASLWYKNLKKKRYREGRDKITTWKHLKKHMRKKFVTVVMYKIYT
ncbi:Lysine-specific histone demethylase 1-like protein 2 [Bienertia sinuspersici]